MTQSFTGTGTALITPFKISGEVDFDGFEKNIEFQIENGIDFLVPLGTTGETPTLTPNEELEIIKFIVETVNHRVPLLFGSGSNSTLEMVNYTNRVKDFGGDGALIVTPYYNKPNTSGLLKHFEAAANVGIPIMVYNIGGRTGRNIATGELSKISTFDNIIGVKEASGNINQVGEVIHKIKSSKSFIVLSGDDGLTFPALCLGADGVISVSSNIVPAKIKAMVDYALTGNLEQARKLHFQLLDLNTNLFVETNPVPIKYAMNKLKMAAGGYRPPLGELENSNKELINKTLQNLELL
jgi:4-hydroxy-tetrahydrodipicolinate synthase